MNKLSVFLFIFALFFGILLMSSVDSQAQISLPTPTPGKDIRILPGELPKMQQEIHTKGFVPVMIGLDVLYALSGLLPDVQDALWYSFDHVDAFAFTQRELVRQMRGGFEVNAFFTIVPGVSMQIMDEQALRRLIDLQDLVRTIRIVGGGGGALLDTIPFVGAPFVWQNSDASAPIGAKKPYDNQ